MELKKHQKECINKIENHFKNENKGLIKMFCGSGKSFIIYHTLLQYTNSISILVVPSINLITQFNRDYLLNDSLKNYNKKYFNKNYELMTICSKNELNNKNLNFTTNENDIIEFLHKKNIKIILITYQSLTNLINIIKINNIIIDLLCFDEAHHILGNNTSKLLYKNNNFINKLINKTLYFTATPKNTKEYKMYDPNSKINNNICGPLIYEYSHINGVNDNILNDFNIRIELYDDNTDINIYKSICRTILETGNNRVLTFHSRSFIKSDKSSDVLSFTNEFNKDELIKCFNDILYNEFSHLKNKYKAIYFEGIVANTKDKNIILQNFDETNDDEIFILSSCKTIGEGIDTKNANMVVFIDPKQSYIEIIQNIGRICRKNEKTTREATVLIPCYINTNIDDIIISKEFNTIYTILTALKQEDPYIFELCLHNNYINEECNKEFKKIKILWKSENCIELNKKIFSYFNKSSIIVDTTELWKEIYYKILDTKNIDNYDLWIINNKKNYKNNTGLMKNIEIKKLWEKIKDEKDIGKFFCTIEENWIKKFNDYKQKFINNDIDNYKQFNDWISRNMENYINNKSLMIIKEIKNEWISFINIFDLYDKCLYEKYEKYINNDIWFIEYENFKDFLESKKKRKLIIRWSKFIRDNNYMIINNNENDRNKINKWIKILNDNKDKNFFLTIEEDFFFHINILKIVIYQNKYHTSLDKEQILFLKNLDKEYMNNYINKNL